MANENNNSEPLVVADDDPTSELEAVTARQHARSRTRLESDAGTFGLPDGEAAGVSIGELRADLRARSETIERLQYDIAQLHSKWLGLEAEIKAREALTTRLTAELENAESRLAGTSQLLQRRDDRIEELESRVRELDGEFRAYRDRIAKAETDRESGQSAGEISTLHELRAQQRRTEAYADELRRQLSDLRDSSRGAMTERDKLAMMLGNAEATIGSLSARLKAAKAESDGLRRELRELARAHEQEIKLLRFELGEAEETLAQNESISEQLASDLVDTRSYRDELERMLAEAETRSNDRIEALEKEVARLEKLSMEQADKLDSKSEAIRCLLEELAKKSHEIDSIGKLEEVIQEIDGRMSERIEDRPVERERVTRLLVGHIGDQELRFPLFKDRLTIGRIRQNDIQLKAHYISRRHAVIVTEGDATRIIDWGSKNGVYVNSRRITEHFLANGDLVTIGTAEFRYEERRKRDA